MNVFARLRERLRRYDRTHNFTCNLCEREVFSNETLCRDCLLHLPKNDGPVCPLCGRAVGEEGLCLECKEERPRTEKARSPLLHEGTGARLVVRFKRGEKFLVYTLCDILEPVLKKEFPEADALTFVPMTKKAEKKRGYNQSRLLAEELSVRTGMPMLDVAVKSKETAPQKTLGRKDRQKNLEGCFHIAHRVPVRGKSIVIVDDTFTTGATTGELADALQRAGAKTVYALTVTSVKNKNPFGEPDPPEKPKKEQKKQRETPPV